jgi:hypothetical protein
MSDLLPLLHSAPTVVALSALRRARAAARRQQARAFAEGAGAGARVLRMLGQGHGVSFPTPAAAAVHGFWLLSRHDWAVTPTRPSRGGTTRMITGAAAYGVELYCTQLGGRVRTVSQLPVTTSSSAVMETSSLEVFKQTHVRGTLVGVHTGGFAVAGMRRGSRQCKSCEVQQFQLTRYPRKKTSLQQSCHAHTWTDWTAALVHTPSVQL